MTLFQGGKYLYLSALIANILPFIVGVVSAWSSSVIPHLENDDLDQIPIGRKINQTEASWIGSLTAMGAIFSSLIFGYFTQKIGRKAMGIIVILPFFIAFLITAFANIIELFYIGRILMGFGTGGMFFASPIYLVEIAEDSNRGLLTASTSMFLMVGMIFSYSIGPFASIMIFNLILATVCFLYCPIFWYKAPESPYYLASINEDEKALKSLQFLRRRASKDLEEELKKIKYNLTSKNQSAFLDIFKSKGATKAFFYCIILTVFQQFAGINVFYSYMQPIFDATESSVSPKISPIIVSSVQLGSSVLALLLSDKIGRKFLLLLSATGAALCEIALGLYFYLYNTGYDVSVINWMPIVSLMIFMLFYKVGVGSLAWPMTYELLPSNVVSTAILPITSLYWLTGFLMTFYFASLSNVIGMAGSFWLFGGFCSVFGLFVYFFIFEIKGKSLSEIQAILNN
ncbi:facilitated trehalose transporter Tret1-like [Tenebrio molitor]|jgi:sugar porter (SP) family MFS transporter|uniref:facilitated trehalose transporter Tret1-like n=1 Tax=Tenebrio molitor TaxID=7067 RepID=UPI001C3B01CA|nr:unnamed protein product [Tenebrio molitor]